MVGLSNISTIYHPLHVQQPMLRGTVLAKGIYWNSTRGDFGIEPKSLPYVIGEQVVRPLIDIMQHAGTFLFNGNTSATLPSSETHSVKISRKLTSSAAALVGEIIALPFDQIPEGFVECNGQSLNADDYPELFAVIGVSYGLGEHINTFKVPNYADFLRGRGSTRQVGSLQEDALQDHANYVPAYDGVSCGWSNSDCKVLAHSYNQNSQSTFKTGATIENGKGQPRLADETRPKNIAVVYVIRVSPASSGMELAVNALLEDMVKSKLNSSTIQTSVQTLQEGVSTLNGWQTSTSLDIAQIKFEHSDFKANTEFRLDDLQSQYSTMGIRLEVTETMAENQQIEIDELHTNIDTGFAVLQAKDAATDTQLITVEAKLADTEAIISSQQITIQNQAEKIRELLQEIQKLRDLVTSVVPEKCLDNSRKLDKQGGDIWEHSIWLTSFSVIAGLNSLAILYLLCRQPVGLPSPKVRP